MKILITGGTGFLGRHTAVRLQGAGHEVTILGRNDRIGQTLRTFSGISYLKAELNDRQRLIDSCRKMDQVIHCGGLASPWGRYKDFYDANVVGTRNIVEACLQNGVRRLVHISTPSLYFDYRDRLQIKESDPLPTPVTHYAATKRLADEEIEAAAERGIEVIGIRPRAIFGPGDQSVMVRLIRAAERGMIPLIDGGKSFVDLSYIDNVVDALLLCLDAPQAALGKNYNITNGEPITVREMMEMLFPKLDFYPRYRRVPFRVAYLMAGSFETYYRWRKFEKEPPLTRYAVGLMAKSQTLDISAAKKELGYQPKIKLEEGFSRFAKWWTQKQVASPAQQLGLTLH